MRVKSYNYHSFWCKISFACLYVNMQHTFQTLSLVFAMPLCASVYMCFVVTCWERADLLALVCGV